jgi:hypothetical protein
MENIDLKSQVVEATDVADVSGTNNAIATDENLSVDAMYQQTALPSLGRQIFSVIPMNGPTAALFNIRKQDGANDFELVRNEVQVFSSSPISTGLTQEVVQDIRSQYGKEANQIIGTLLRGLANEQENTSTLTFLDAQCKAETALTLTDATNAETNAFQISQKVHELVLKANSKNMRSYESFAVLPYSAAAAFAALNSYVGGLDKDERGLFIAEVGNTKYFMNPDATSTTAYVGIKDTTNPSKSSAVFSPYATQVVESQNPDSGALVYNIFNRYAITASPLHVTNNEMLFKFEIA